MEGYCIVCAYEQHNCVQKLKLIYKKDCVLVPIQHKKKEWNIQLYVFKHLYSYTVTDIFERERNVKQHMPCDWCWTGRFKGQRPQKYAGLHVSKIRVTIWTSMHSFSSQCCMHMSILMRHIVTWYSNWYDYLHGIVHILPPLKHENRHQHTSDDRLTPHRSSSPLIESTSS
jgi:hypothetical protein